MRFLSININNGRRMTITQGYHDGPICVATSNGGAVDSNISISAGEMVMLINYYRACKSGAEKGDYISKD